MADIYADRVKEFTRTYGTGTIDLGGPEIGHQSFVVGFGEGANRRYGVVAEDGGWEIGEGTVTAGTPDTLSRDTIFSNSNGDTSPIVLTGLTAVFSTLPATLILDASNNLSDVDDVAMARTNLGLGVGDSPTLTGLTLSGLTSGSIPFIGTDGLISQDNFNLYWDAPANELQPNLLKITSDGTQASPALKFNDTNTGFYKSGDSVSFSLNNSTKMTIDGTGVGIGITVPNEKLSVNGNLVLNKTSGEGIKIDNTTPTFGWRDLLGETTTRNTGASKPSFEAYNGAIVQYRFSNGDLEHYDFHIPHDYVAGTDIHLHIHWSQISTTNTGGTVTFRYSAVYAKGHNQAAFTSTPITATFASGDAGTTQYQQHITEIVISAATATAALFDKDDLEPDGVILMTLEMDANNLTDSVGVTDPFIHYVDIHYQSTNIGTKDKAPDFYA